MKKVLFLFSTVLVLVALLGADIRRKKEAAAVVEEKRIICKGYTIIEFGKGINCNGDTVRLTKVEGGGQQLSRTTEVISLSSKYK